MISWAKYFIPFFLLIGNAQAATILSEDFNDVTLLPGAGWVTTNNSSPLGDTGWFQGNDGIFPAQAGASSAYIAANFNNALGTGNISNWLLTPVLSLNNGDSLSFFSRTVPFEGFPDRIEVRLSTNGSSSNVGMTDTSVGDFGLLLLTVNPLLEPTGYPEDWTLFTVSLSGLSGTTDGRFAFRYFVSDTSLNADYIGIDTVSVNTASISVPEPSALLLIGAGIMSLSIAGLRRHYG